MTSIKVSGDAMSPAAHNSSVLQEMPLQQHSVGV